MKWNIFERRNAKKIKEHTTPLDVEAMWQSVLPEIHQKKNRSSNLIWIVALLVLGSVGISYFLLQPSTGTLISNKKEISAPKFVESPTSNIEAQNSDKIAFINEPRKQNKKQPVLSEKEIQAKTPQEKLTSNKIALPSDEFTSKGELNTSNIKELQKKNITERPIPIGYNQDSNTAKFSSIRENAKTTDVNSIASLAFLKIMTFDESQKEFKSIKLNHQKISIEKINTSSKPQFHFGINLISGIGFTNKNLNATSELGPDFTALKANTETSLETFNFALALKAMHQSNFYLTSGISYKRINERLNINDNHSLFGTEQNAIIEIYTDANGQEFISNGPAKKETTLALDIVHYNSHEIFSVPLAIGYEFNLNALKVSPELGVNMNFRNISQGRTLTGNSYEDLSDVTNSNHYKTDLGLSYLASLNFSYSMTSNYEIGLAPFYEYFPNSFSVTSAPISEFYTRMGINLNLAYNF